MLGCYMSNLYVMHRIQIKTNTDQITTSQTALDTAFDNCKEYGQNDTLAKCYENKQVSVFNDLINCTPPWMSDTAKCTGKLNVDENLFEIFTKTIFEEILV